MASPKSTEKAPSLFRVLVAAYDLGKSVRFFETLLHVRGRFVATGRFYFDCGSVILGVLDYGATPAKERPAPTEALYFATAHLDQIHRRARQLDCLDPSLIHGDPANPAGEIVVRPWGERSFYAIDPAGNPLCFVDARTVFTGTRPQITALERAHRAK
jgi:hypothetical protein